MSALILDLRNNPGGLLDSACEVSEMFLEMDSMIVSTRGRAPDQNLEFKAKYSNPYTGFPMIVMINDGSASASEIVAGAIKDHGRGILLGTKSFGKGSVQTVIPLKDGSALRLTTSKYFTPSGISIHGEGIIPDVVVKYEERSAIEEEEDGSSDEIFEKIENGVELEEKDGDDDEEPFILDSQLLRAIDLLKGINIYNKRN